MKKIVCKACGTKNKGKNQFCTKCGANLAEQEQIPAPVQDDAVVVNAEQPTDVAAAQMEESRAEQFEMPAPKKKKKKFVIPIVIAGSILILGGGGLNVLSQYLPLGKKSGQEIANMFNDGLVPFREGDKFGYLNKKGEIAINQQFDYVSDFSEGLACVGIGSEGNMEYGYINPKGDYVIDTQYSDATPFYDGMAVVTSGQYMGVIDTKGKYKINPQYKYGNLEYAGNKIFLINDGDNDYGELYNDKGKKISDKRFIGVEDFEPDADLIPLETINGTISYINSLASTTLKPEI